MSELKALQQLIEKELQQINFPSRPSTLYEPISYMLSIGGKRLRPVLVLLSNQLFNGKIENAISQALAIEVFHNFTLLHDDIMDNATVRRTKPTVHTKWNASTAILSGDAMFVKSIQLLVKNGNIYTEKLLQEFTASALEVCEGQQMDMDYQLSDEVSIDDYLEMIRLKTAVLLGCSLKLGAITAGAGEVDADHIYDFGCNLGMAFQVQDDLLDLYGDEDRFGKTPGGDIVANKKTYLLLKAFEISGDEQRNHLKSIISNQQILPAEKVRAVKIIFDALNIAALTEEKMEQYYSSAMDQLDKINADPSAKKHLIALAEELKVRIH